MDFILRVIGIVLGFVGGYYISDFLRKNVLTGSNNPTLYSNAKGVYITFETVVDIVLATILAMWGRRIHLIIRYFGIGWLASIVAVNLQKEVGGTTS